MPKTDKQGTALRKRQQISQANKTMFLWVAGASALVGIAGVVVWSLSQRLVYNEEVLGAKQTTISNLRYNNSIIDELKKNVRVRNTDSKLAALKVETENEPAEVVFDALPSAVNSTALGSSLQSNKLLGQDGVKIEALSTTPVSGIEDSSENATSTIVEATSDNVIEFKFTVSVGSNDVSKLTDILQRLERSVRTFTVTKVHIEKTEDKLEMSVEGYAYYQPAKKVEMQTKLVPEKMTKKKAVKK